jgi:putative ABC transport system permease protein
VGTTPTYGDFYKARVAVGRWWREPMEVVLGAQAARSLGLNVGATFVGQHGLNGGETHGESPYRVVGVLQPTGAVIDRLALTDTESVWRVHEHHEADEAAAVRVSHGESESAHDEHIDEEHAGEEHEQREVTALLVKYRSPMSALMLPRMVGAMPDIQAAVPALEVARLNVLFGTGADVLRGFGLALLGLSALGFFTALFAAVQQRQRELALLRTLGGSRGLLLGLVSLEALALGLVGGALGVVLGRAAALIAANAAAASGGPLLDLPTLGATEMFAFAAAAFLSLAAALAPGLLAYRLEPVQALRMQ